MRDLDALFRFIEERRTIPFAWARPFDCVSFADGAIAAQTGRTLLADLHWSSRAEAVAAARKAGGLRRAVGARLRRVAPAMAARGDIAGIRDKLLGVRLMVVEGATLVAPGPAGLQRLPRATMVVAWSIEGPGDE